MHLYSLGSYKTLVCILYLLLLQHTAHQLSLHKRSPEDDSSNRQDLTNAKTDNETISSPFIVFMSSDTVAIAQLPMIIYGNLMEVYTLSDEQQQDDGGFEREDTEKDESGAAVVGEDEDDDFRPRKAQHGNVHDADAREFEQMPHMMSVNTTTSLGKSEWQQIAVGAPDREEVSLQKRAGIGEGTRNGPGEGTKEGQEEDERHLGRRPRSSSNSSKDHDGPGNNSSAAAWSESSKEAGDDHSNSPASIGADEHTLRGAQESNFQNVTSAATSPPQSNTIVQQQPNLASVSNRAAEDGDKISRPSAASSSQAPGPSPPSLAATSSSSSSRVYFSDVDVHMALGYAFVADSLGRVHRIKLPVRPKSSLAPGKGATLRYPSSHAKSTTVANGESGAIVNDDTTNAIDASVKFSLFQTKVVNAANGTASDSPARFNANHDNTGYDAASAESHTNSILSNAYDANKGRSGRNMGVTHGQTQNESQHPAISGEQDDLSNSAHSDSPVSGHSRLASYSDPQAQGHGFSVDKVSIFQCIEIAAAILVLFINGHHDREMISHPLSYTEAACDVAHCSIQNFILNFKCSIVNDHKH
jgi:hypothetical protein